jgi:hypothetical protein
VAFAGAESFFGAGEHGSVAFVPGRCGHPGHPSPGVQDVVDLGEVEVEVEVARGAGHDVLPLAVELRCALGQEGGAHLCRGGVGEGRPILCRSGAGGGAHAGRVAAPHDILGSNAPSSARVLDR